MSHMSEVQPHADLHDGTTPDLKHGSREWDMMPSQKTQLAGGSGQHDVR